MSHKLPSLKISSSQKINESATIYFLIQAVCYELKWTCYLNLHYYILTVTSSLAAKITALRMHFAQKQDWDNAEDV